MVLTREFFRRDTITAAKSLLGQIVVSYAGGIETRGIIVETEAYRGRIDYAGEAKDYLWRFTVSGNPFVSKK